MPCKRNQFKTEGARPIISTFAGERAVASVLRTYLFRLSNTDQITDPMVNNAPITGSISDDCK